MQNTKVGTDFTTYKLVGVPTATDIWAVLGQASGVRMNGFDVGGSHKSQQTGYESFGIRNQNRVLNDGVDTTEGTGGAGFYADYFANEEVSVAAAGGEVGAADGCEQAARTPAAVAPNAPSKNARRECGRGAAPSRVIPSPFSPVKK